MIDLSKDYSIKNIKEQFKNNGIFYTSEKLAHQLLEYVNIDYKTVYDPTCGRGNLLAVCKPEALKYGQELNSEELAVAKQILGETFVGMQGDTLENDKFKGEQFDVILANPPFSIKWNSKGKEEDERFKDVGIVPTDSKADYAFILHILHHLKPTGVAVCLNFPGVLYRGNREGKIRKWLIEQNYIDRVVHIPGGEFEDTKIATAILVLKKNKTTTDIVFEDKERKKEKVVSFEEIKENDFLLSVPMYLPEDIIKEKIDIEEINNLARKNAMNKILSEIEMEIMLNDTFGSTVKPVEFINELIEKLETIKQKEIKKEK